MELDLIKSRVLDDFFFLDVVVPVVDFKIKAELSGDCLFLQGLFVPNRFCEFYKSILNVDADEHQQTEAHKRAKAKHEELKQGGGGFIPLSEFQK